MKLVFAERAWDDYLYWQKTDRKILDRINRLIQEATRTPYEGAGKPEPLKHEAAGWWSRRVTEVDRMVYRVTEDALEIAQLRFHY